MTKLNILKKIAEMRRLVAQWRSEGLTVGLVPTMGGLHLGHKSLVKFASNKCDRVIVSIFINPTQFTEEEDFEIYPQTQDADCVLIKEAGGNAVFIPDISEMYPKGFSTKVSVSGLTNIMCGASRPGHFDGVTQVVTKLLNQASANNVYFGEKDWQQLAIIKRLVSDLDIPTNIVSVPTVRDEFGLALSSRNSYLNSSQLQTAQNLSSVLQKAAYNIAAGGCSSVECDLASKILLNSGIDKIDYIECRNSHSLKLIERTNEDECRIFAAVYINNVRLIDNHIVV
ncbi:pantoate--beta-alanine ligase [Amylibacter sp.]|nr:pantoate--beta-alanine ligase [Amylibacter sp.]MDB2337760.1 pantoate--beta-alanine ligase [Amylibacter sp.]MDB2472385.1 pantoate--beta-alanine ligase [Amylibacter sp.]MDB4221975.1 pantoate--beta-alanine ligase [Amylibacter sp.]